MSEEKFVFDTYAILALLEDEPGAQIVADISLSYADAFVLGLAREIMAPVVTGDPEIDIVAKEIGIEIVWIGKEIVV